MIDGLKPYPQMKDSGVPWLGDVPEHWVTLPLKRWVKMNRSVLPESTPPGYEFRYLDIGSVGTGVLTVRPQHLRFAAAPSRARRVVRDGDTIVSTVRTYLKAVYFVDRDTEELVCSTGFAVLTPPSRTVPKFVSYLCQSSAFTDRVTADSVGIAYPAIAETRLGAFHVVVPPLPEQAAIVRFLDHADRRIRRYIRAKQKLIKLLEEQKQAIIHRAVTRGLDPNVRLKPSGVEWLGDVPEHWEVRRNGRLFAQRNETGFGDLPILEVSLKTGVRVRDFETSDRKQVMADREKYKRAVAGDIAYNMMRMWQGAAGVAPVDGLISPAYVVAKPLPGTEPRYYEYLFRLPAYMGEVDKYSRGIVKDRNRLYWENFKQIPSCYPPYIEQVAIADAIARMTAGIEAASDRVRREIAPFMEYRTRLIADVVTGKLDVREVAARLPEEAEELEPLDEAEALGEAEDESAADDLDPEPQEAEA